MQVQSISEIQHRKITF